MNDGAEYLVGDEILVPIGIQIGDSVRTHEFSHLLLNKLTHWGMMNHFFAQIRRADRLFSRFQYHSSIGDIIKQAAETTYESHAIVNQLLACESTGDEEGISAIKNGLYYQAYNTKYIEAIVSLPLPIITRGTINNLIAQYVLATDLSKIPASAWISSESLVEAIMEKQEILYPDKRLEIIADLVNSTKISCPEDIENRLIKKSNLEFKAFDINMSQDIYLAFSNLVRSVFPDDQCMNDAIELVNKIYSTGKSDYFRNRIEVLDLPVPRYDAETVQIAPDEPWNFDWEVVFVLPYHELVLLKYYDSMQHKEYVRLCTWRSFLGYLNLFGGVVVLYEDDFLYIQEKCPNIFDFQPFFYHQSLYQYFRDDIDSKTDTSPDACLFLVDDSTSCLFVKPENGYVQFTIQNKNSTAQILSDIHQGRYNCIFTKNDGRIIGNIDAYEEDYADVIKAALQIPEIKGYCQQITYTDSHISSLYHME